MEEVVPDASALIHWDGDGAEPHAKKEAHKPREGLEEAWPVPVRVLARGNEHLLGFIIQGHASDAPKAIIDAVLSQNGL